MLLNPPRENHCFTIIHLASEGRYTRCSVTASDEARHAKLLITLSFMRNLECSPSRGDKSFSQFYWTTCFTKVLMNLCYVNIAAGFQRAPRGKVQLATINLPV